MVVFTWSRVFKIGWMSVRCIDLIHPEILPFCVREEVGVLCLGGLLLWAYRLESTVWERPLVVFDITSLLLIIAWSRVLSQLQFQVLTVWYLAQKHSTVDLGIVVLLLSNSDYFILTRSRVLLSWKVVLSGSIWLKDLPRNFTADKVCCSLSLLHMAFLQGVASRTYCVMTQTTVCILRYLPCWYWRSSRLWLDNQVSMLELVVVLLYFQEFVLFFPFPLLLIRSRPYQLFTSFSCLPGL